MLLVCTSRNQLDFGQLMEVYLESNSASGAEYYPHLDVNLQRLEAEQDFYLFLNEFFYADHGMYFIWVLDGRYKAALRLQPYKDGFLLSGLETAPDSRKIGIAKNLMTNVLRYMTSINACKIYSHIHKKNIASLHTHLSCGFEKFYDYASYIDGSIDHNCYTYVKNAVPK